MATAIATAITFFALSALHRIQTSPTVTTLSKTVERDKTSGLLVLLSPEISQANLQSNGTSFLLGGSRCFTWYISHQSSLQYSLFALKPLLENALLSKIKHLPSLKRAPCLLEPPTMKQRARPSSPLLARRHSEDEYQRAQSTLEDFHRAHSLWAIEEDDTMGVHRTNLTKQTAVVCLRSLSLGLDDEMATLGRNRPRKEEVDRPNVGERSADDDDNDDGWGFFMEEHSQAAFSTRQPSPVRARLRRLQQQQRQQQK